MITAYPFGSALAPPEFGGVRVGHLFSFLRGVVFLGLVFFCVLCHVRPMFPVSLECSFFTVPSVFSNVYIYIFMQCDSVHCR